MCVCMKYKGEAIVNAEWVVLQEYQGEPKQEGKIKLTEPDHVREIEIYV